MDKRTRVKKNTSGNGETSSSLQMSRRLLKKAVTFLNQITYDEIQMLMEILKYLRTQNLLKVRQVNKTWCEISSGILNKRNDAIIPFAFSFLDQFMWGNLITGQRGLWQFVDRMKRCKNHPFSHFAFAITDHSKSTEGFDHKDFKEFLKDFAGSHQIIKSLQLGLVGLKSIETFQFFTAKLGELIQNEVSFIQDLVLNFKDSVEAPQLKLFPISVSTPAQFQFVNLKSIRFACAGISSYVEIVKDLLNAAVNLTAIRMCVKSLEDLQLLKSLGKFHLLKEAEVEIDEKFLASLKKCGSMSLPKLDFLHIKMCTEKQDEIFLTQASKFLVTLFESCKDTLKVLLVQPALGFLPNLQLPTFKNLQELIIDHRWRSDQIFPSGTRSRNVFPAVSELELHMGDWPDAFPQEDSIPLLPNLKVLNLKDQEIEPDVIYKVSLMCPNLIKFQTHRDDEEDYLNDPDDDPDEMIDLAPKLDFLQAGRAIWTHMKKLDVLELDFNHHASEHILDSWLTGISVENCRILKYKMMDSGDKCEHGEFKIPEIDENELIAMREFPSILDMKELRKLILNPYCGKELLKKNEVFSKNVSWIGHEYALKLMPHLKPNED